MNTMLDKIDWKEIRDWDLQLLLFAMMSFYALGGIWISLSIAFVAWEISPGTIRGIVLSVLHIIATYFYLPKKDDW